MSAEAARRAHLEAAGWNVMNLDPATVELDLMTDVPPRSYLGAAAAPVSDAEPDLASAATPLYGDAHYVFTTKGRAAELALGAALAVPGSVTLAHPLFKTTQASITRFGGKVEAVKTLGPDTADVDLGWLEQRLAVGDVRIVYLEPGTNALGGVPLSLAGTRAVAERCRARGVTFLLDAARLLANALRCDGAEPRAYTDLADAFTVSCAKELRVPYGALVGVRDRDLQKKIFGYAFDEGALLEPLAARWQLHAGLRAASESRTALIERRAQLEVMAAQLQGAGVPVRRPIGGHALYLPFAAELVAAPLSNRSLECMLYANSGIRSLLNPYPSLGGFHMRIALAVGRYADAELAAVAPALRALLDGAPRAPRLEASDAPRVHDLFTRYRPAPA